jgi:hypothetical protein
MKKIKQIIFPVFLLLLAPGVLADIVGPPPGLMIGMFFMVLIACLFLNYGINFAVTLGMTRIISKTPLKKIAKGLLIITPIMLAFETLFIYSVAPRYSWDLVLIWVLSAGLIFGCYFSVGQKMWRMDKRKAAIIGGCMAVITNPAYLLAFFI